MFRYSDTTGGHLSYILHKLFVEVYICALVFERSLKDKCMIA